ncbi:GTP-binding protein At3g49725, chloroplastic [Ricinus communis]|uniref:GTP-binding protein At3g49725, chloroplastic n=1 Tax=Ricinus communis TaxID=3988 RepID=UPI00201A3AAA|nr:GTP-binding protein At3g49725, chloroplastic [Ricinus communis]
MLALSSLRSRLSSNSLALSQTLTIIYPHQSITHSQFSSKQHQQNSNEIDTHGVVSIINRDPTSPPRLFVVQPRLRPDSFLQAKLNEALCLANSLEEQRDGYFDTDFFDKALPPHVIVQNPILRSSRARADTFFGPGTVNTIKCHLNASESKGEVDAVFVNSVLTGVQQRNLERAWGRPVLDRVGLIIEIFNAHAHTKEAKLQSELAALMYKKSRLVRARGLDGRYTFGTAGEAEVVSARGRGSGGRGFISGAGETELQLQRRRILERRNYLLSQIREVRRTRAVQRAARKRDDGLHNKGLATVAVVGYTNAGKSTMVSTLSNSDLYSDSRLFATLDPRLKSVVLPSGRKVLFSDTVGFISDLPVQLVEAFRATLEEVVEADLLVHVIDSTAPNLEEHHTTVLQVLQQIGVSKEKLQSMIEVWNKIDYEEEEMDVDHSADDVDGSSWSGDEDGDIASEISSRIEDNKGNNCLEAQNGEGDIEETLDSVEGEYSDGWLLSGDEQELVGDNWLKTLDDQQCKASDNPGVGKDILSQAEHGPHVKTSAITGVGLQELLVLVDERLKTQDEMLKAQNVVGRDLFYRKWRPSRADDTEAAVGQ